MPRQQSKANEDKYDAKAEMFFCLAELCVVRLPSDCHNFDI